MSDGPVAVKLYADGSEAEDSLAIISVSIRKAVNRISQAKIEFLDGDMPNQDFPLSNEDTFKPGAEIEIQAGYGSEYSTVFKGVVVRHSVRVVGENLSRLVIECRDKSVAMTVGRKNANFVDQKDSDIMASLVGNYSGLSSDISATTYQYAELVQYYCTDWDFLLTRAEANGMLVSVDDATVTVAAPKTSSAALFTVTYGTDLIEFNADLDAVSQLTSVTATSWDPSSQASADSSAKSPDDLSLGGDVTGSTLSAVVSPDSFVLQTQAPAETTVLDQWAGAWQTRAGLARIRGSMKIQGRADARPGKIVKLSGVGNRFNGNQYISAVNHRIADGNWITEIDFGLSDQAFAENRDLVAPPASGLVPGIEGLQIGVVLKLDEDPANENRIQVKVPVMKADTEGVWARLASFYCSSSAGDFFVPEIGDEVILGYLNNDPASPVILGSVYSSSRQPPYTLTAENNTKAIVTRSQLKVEFDDDKKVITIVTPANNKVVLDDDGQSILLQDQNNNKLEMNSSGITITSASDLTLSASGNVSISATGNLSESASGDVSVDGANVSQSASVGFTASGSASAELSASGTTTVKGATVMIN